MYIRKPYMVEIGEQATGACLHACIIRSVVAHYLFLHKTRVHVERVSKLLVIQERKEGKKWLAAYCQHSMNSHCSHCSFWKWFRKTPALKRTTSLQLAMAKNGHSKISNCIIFLCVCVYPVMHRLQFHSKRKKKERGLTMVKVVSW